jgi:hypothetical protein
MEGSGSPCFGSPGGHPPPTVWRLQASACPGFGAGRSSCAPTSWLPASETASLSGGRFRMERGAADRFLAGHSSGGWSALWLQVNYPGAFGGAWATAPDPVDFRSFCGPNLASARPGNFYRDARGRPYRFDRHEGRDTTTLREYVLRDIAAPVSSLHLKPSFRRTAPARRGIFSTTRAARSMPESQATGRGISISLGSYDTLHFPRSLAWLAACTFLWASALRRRSSSLPAKTTFPS